MKKLLLSVALLATINSFGQKETLLQDFNYTVNSQETFDASIEDQYAVGAAGAISSDGGAAFLYGLGYSGTLSEAAGFPAGEKIARSYTFNTQDGLGATSTDDVFSFVAAKMDLEANKAYNIKFDVGIFNASTFDVLTVSIFQKGTDGNLDPATIEDIVTLTFTSSDFGTVQSPSFEIPSSLYTTGEYGILFTHTITGFDAAGASPGGWLAGVGIDKITLVETGVLSTNSVVASKFAVFPNPSNGSEFVNFTGDNIQATGASVFNLLGKEVLKVSQNELANKQINISTLAKGLYLLNIETNEGVVTKKIIKN